jgi:hypothetical protein
MSTISRLFITQIVARKQPANAGVSIKPGAERTARNPRKSVNQTASSQRERQPTVFGQGFRLRLHPRLYAVADFVGYNVGPVFREKNWVMTSTHARGYSLPVLRA